MPQIVLTMGYTSGVVLARLRAGKLLNLSYGDLSRGYIGEFLSGGAELLYNDVCRKLGVQQYHALEGIESHVKDEYYRVLANILNLTQERKHGGTYIILPRMVNIENNLARENIFIKYRLDEIYFDLWDCLVEESIAYRKYIDTCLPQETGNPRKDIPGLPDDRHWQAMKEKIHEWEIFISSLSGVDGAVVLTRKLEVLGFGAEILTPSGDVSTVKVAGDPSGDYCRGQGKTDTELSSVR